MQEKRVVIVGAGGIGSLLSRSIAMTLEWTMPGSALLIVDGDNFEAKNKQRQFFNGVGNKAEVLANELIPQFDKTFIIPMVRKTRKKTERHLQGRSLLAI